MTSQLLNPQFLNYSYIDFDHKINAQVGVKQYTGSSSDIQTVMALLGVNFKKQNTHQAIRVNLWAMNEGPYIANQRFAFNYALAYQLKEKRYINFGMDVAMFSRIYSAPTASTQGNAFVPDATASFSYQSSNFSIGASLNQLLSAKTQLLTSTFKLARYPSVYGNYVININQDQAVCLYAYGRLIPEIGVQEIVSTTYRWKKKLEVGVGHKYQKELSFIASGKFDVSGKEIKIDVCMNIPHSTARNTVGESLEFIIGANF